MGCKASKVEDLPLVVICKKRKDLIRAASDHRYALAVAHISYFRSLRDVGEALCRFVDEELVLSGSSSSTSSLSSPVFTLPSDEGKDNGGEKRTQRRRNLDRPRKNSSSTSISHSVSNVNFKNRNQAKKGEDEDDEEDEEDSHLHLSSSDYSEDCSSSGRGQVEDGPARGKYFSPQPGISYSPNASMMNNNNYYNPYYPSDNSYGAYDSGAFSSNGNSYGVYYMKKSSSHISSMIYQEPKPNPIYSYSDYNQNNPPPYENAGNFGFALSSMPSEQAGTSKRQQQMRQPPPMPPSPKVTAWDYFNLFETYDNNGYPVYYENGAFEYDSSTSSTDSMEVREREGIPELEEETESDVIKEVFVKKNKKKLDEGFSRSNRSNKNRNVQFDEGQARYFDAVQDQQQPPLPQQPMLEKFDEFHPNIQQFHAAEEPLAEVKEVTTSGTTSNVSYPVTADEVHLKRKGSSFEMDGASQHDIDSSKVSSLTALSAYGTRDLREVVSEIRDEFEAATDYGKEVCHLLEAEKLPYRSRSSFSRGTLSNMLCPVEESVSASEPQTRLELEDEMERPFAREFGSDFDSSSLVSTLDKIYMWEKKLYKEVKGEEKLRIMYEKQCKKLRHLNDQGAETTKIGETQESIKRLLVRINVSIKAVDVIARRIHHLRDKELQPQLRELIIGLRRMWKMMLKCHQKQYQAILQSKISTLRANTGFHKDSASTATVELETELLKWSSRFNHWVELQKSYAKSLNAWLSSYLTDKPEETSDGPIPFSPGRAGAPPAFVICHDWEQAMERVSESGASETVVEAAMNDFASSLHQLWERQDEEKLQRLKAEFTLKDFEKQVHLMRDSEDVLPNGKESLSMVASEVGFLRSDDFDALKERVKAERTGHKEAVKLVHAAVSRSIQAGLVPIFEALEGFTSQAVKAYGDVRVNVNVSGSCKKR